MPDIPGLPEGWKQCFSNGPVPGLATHPFRQELFVFQGIK